MSSNLTPITVRTDDDILKAKLQCLARSHGRSLSKEAEQILRRYVQYYEKKHGEIKLKE
jgi:plasmid stability protein